MTSGEPGQTSQRFDPRRGQEGRQARAARRLRRRLPRPGPDVLHGRLPGHLRDADRRSTRSSPTTDEPVARPRRGRAARSPRTEDRHGEAEEGRQVRPAGQPRHRGEGRQVRLRARVLEERPEPVHDATSASSRARRRSRGAIKDDLRHRIDRRPEQDHVQADQAAGRRRFAAFAGDADDDAGPEGVRGEVRQEEPVDVQRERRRRPARTWSRTTPQGKLTGYKAGKSIQLVRNPNWDKDQDFRPAYLDEILLTHERDRRQRVRPPGAPGPEPGRSTRTRRRRCSSGSCSARRTSSSRVPGGGFR